MSRIQRAFVLLGLVMPAIVAPTVLLAVGQRAVRETQLPAHQPSPPTSTRLSDGRFLVVGGSDTSGRCAAWLTADAPAQRTELPWAGPVPCSEQTATLLADGRVLIVGGRDNSGVVVSTPTVFDPETDRPGP